MEKVIIDIGSGKTKSYIIDENNQIMPLYEQIIGLKEGYDYTSGLAIEHKIILFNTINKIKSMAEGRPIHIYATSVFRTMSDDIRSEFIKEFYNETGLEFNVVSSERESELMTMAVKNLVLDEPYLVTCIGNGSTEMNIMRNGLVVESVNIEFAKADLIKAFPALKDEICNVDLIQLENFVEKNMKFPKLKSDYAIILGFNNLSKSRACDFKLLDNLFFKESSIPVYLDYQQFVVETIKLFKTFHLENYIEIFRAHCIIVKCILQKIQAKYCFPTNLNMIDGIVEELKQDRKSEQGKKHS